MRNKMAEIKLRLERMQTNTPTVMLLQEVDTRNINISGYKTYEEPTIVYKTSPHKDNDPKGVAALLIRDDIPHAVVDTKNICDAYREVVAARIMIKKNHS